MAIIFSKEDSLGWIISVFLTGALNCPGICSWSRPMVQAGWECMHLNMMDMALEIAMHDDYF